MAQGQHSYEISYQVENARHELYEQPSTVQEELDVPVAIFRHASTMQALVRHLVDTLGLSHTEAARLLGRSVKSTWTSYRQADELPEYNDDGLTVPLRIFTEDLAPLEALVYRLRKRGFRNKEIAQLLDLSEKTTSTAYRRAEVKR